MGEDGREGGENINWPCLFIPKRRSNITRSPPNAGNYSFQPHLRCCRLWKIVDNSLPDNSLQASPYRPLRSCLLPFASGASGGSLRVSIRHNISPFWYQFFSNFSSSIVSVDSRCRCSTSRRFAEEKTCLILADIVEMKSTLIAICCSSEWVLIFLYHQAKRLFLLLICIRVLLK